MIDVYRTPAKRHGPSCLHCMTGRWAVYDAHWTVWRCEVCGEEWEDYGIEKYRPYDPLSLQQKEARRDTDLDIDENASGLM